MSGTARLEVKMPPWKKNRIRKFCKSIGEDMSDFTRQAIDEKMERLKKCKGIKIPCE